MNKTSYYKHSIFNIIFSLFYILPFGFLPLYDYFVSIGKPIADSIFDIFSSVLFLLFFCWYSDNNYHKHNFFVL